MFNIVFKTKSKQTMKTLMSWLRSPVVLPHLRCSSTAGVNKICKLHLLASEVGQQDYLIIVTFVQ